MDAYTVENIPFGILEEFGLTREMIEDLPEFVLEKIIRGGRSPLLPLKVETKLGYSTTYARFKIINAADGTDNLDILFYPKLSEAPIQNFTAEEQSRLLAGKVIIADLSVPDAGEDTSHTERCFVQIDPETNHVFYVNSSVIARNITSVDTVLCLSPSDVQKLMDGKVVELDTPEYVTVGINLFTETGVLVCPGDEDNWKYTVGRRMPEYSFGLGGCWVMENGLLRYVKEDDFDLTITEARLKLSEKNRHNNAVHQSEQPQQQQQVTLGKDQTVQITR